MAVTDENAVPLMSGATTTPIPTLRSLKKASKHGQSASKRKSISAFSPHPVNSSGLEHGFQLISSPPEDGMRTPGSRVLKFEPSSGSSSGSLGSGGLKRSRAEQMTPASPNSKRRKLAKSQRSSVAATPNRDGPSAHSRSRALKASAPSSHQSTPKRGVLPKLDFERLRSPLISRNAPIPPSSPTDDPILLVGDSEPDWEAHARALEPKPKIEEDDTFLPATPRTNPGDISIFDTPSTNPGNVSGIDRAPSPDNPFAHTGSVDVDKDDKDQVMLGAEPLGPVWSPIRRLSPRPNSTDSDSDNEPAEELDYIVPTQQDPPTARSKARSERFGRPKSPYPLERSTTFSAIHEDAEEEEDDDDDGPILPPELTRAPVRTGSLPNNRRRSGPAKSSSLSPLTPSPPPASAPTATPSPPPASAAAPTPSPPPARTRALVPIPTFALIPASSPMPARFETEETLDEAPAPVPFSVLRERPAPPRVIRRAQRVAIPEARAQSLRPPLPPQFVADEDTRIHNDSAELSAMLQVGDDSYDQSASDSVDVSRQLLTAVKEEFFPPARGGRLPNRSRDNSMDEVSFALVSQAGDSSVDREDEVERSMRSRSWASDTGASTIDGNLSVASTISRGRSRHRRELSDESEEEEQDPTGPGVIQISSKDPIAAARAAAILKKHHKYIQDGFRSQHSRSRSRSVSRSRHESPAVSIVSNSDLLRLTEAELELEAHESTPPPQRFKPTAGKRKQELEPIPQEIEYDPDTTQWAKIDWKMLDRCFTEVRLLLAEQLNMHDEDGPAMVGPDEVEPKDVVERFLDLAFGDERDDREDELEGDWSRSKISRRVLALRTKQRGNPAPTPRMASATSGRHTPTVGFFHGGRAPSETPSMLVPEFTPLISHGVVHAGGKGRVYPDLHKLLGGGSQPMAFPRRPDFGMPPPPKRLDSVLSTSTSASNQSLAKEFATTQARERPSAQNRAGALSPAITSSAGRRTPQSARGTVNFPRQVAASIEDVPAELVNLTPRLKSPPPKSPSRRQFVPSTPSHIRVAIEPPSSAKRMMGYLGSWLGVSKPLARSRDVPSTVPSRTGPRLPPPPPARERNVATPPRRLTEREKAPTASLHRPPPSVRELSPDAMHPRDSVDLQHATPRQWEPEDILHPRDSVDLQHAEQSIYEPERIIHPRDTVQLQHVSPPPQQAKPALGRQRTASGSSVKDLIKNFEASTTPARNSDLELARLKMQRSRSFQNLSQHTASQSNAAVVRSASVNMSASPSWRS